MNDDKITFNPDFVGAEVFEEAQPWAVGSNPCASEAGTTAPTTRGRKRSHPIPFSLQWAAGFADGEGCIFIFKQVYTKSPGRNPAYRLGFSITQNNLPVLDHFLRGLGVHGKVYASTRTLGHNRQVYELKYTGVHALKVIGMLQPHLIRKQQEAQTALNYWQFAKGGKRPGPAGWLAGHPAYWLHASAITESSSRSSKGGKAASHIHPENIPTLRVGHAVSAPESADAHNRSTT